MRKVTIIIDVQNDFVTGSLGSEEAKAIVPNVVEKARNAKELYFTKDTHYEDYMDTFEGKMLPVPHCVIGTEGHDLIPELQEFENEHAIIYKRTFGFLDWEEIFLDTEDIEFEVCGLCTDICVLSNCLILRAAFPDSRIVVDAACCAGVTPEKHKAALEVMKSCQIEVINE